MSLPGNNAASAEASPIAGTVLPIQRAEELLATLPGVLSARIVASATGAVEEIHILTTTDVTPKQTVRNVESALIAHLGMRVGHKKISVATTTDEAQRPAQRVSAPMHASPFVPKLEKAEKHEKLDTVPASASLPLSRPSSSAPSPSPSSSHSAAPTLLASMAEPSNSLDSVLPRTMSAHRRRFYFEDIEVRRSRAKGVACRVTLRKSEQLFVGEAEGVDNERFGLEVAARATLDALKQAEGEAWLFALEGCKLIDAFERHFVFVGVVTREGRDNYLVTGSAEVRESPEAASALAVLDATNRWLTR